MQLRKKNKIPLSYYFAGFIVVAGFMLNFSARYIRMKFTAEWKALSQQMTLSTRPAASLEEALKNVQREMHFWEGRFPSREEEVLRMINGAAKEGKVDLQSIHSLPRSPALGEDNMPFLVGEKTCQQVVISLDLKGTYSDLIRYLELLRKKLNVVYIIEQARLSKVSPDTSELRLKLTLKIFLLL